MLSEQTKDMQAPSHPEGAFIFLELNVSGSVGLVKTEYAHFDTELQLESGRLLGPITLAYETYGTLAGIITQLVIAKGAP